MKKPRIVVTLGDPSGVGPEVVAKALARPELRELADLSVIGSTALLFETWQRLGLEGLPPQITELSGVPGGPFPVGQLSVDSARASHAWVEHAAQLCISGEVDAMVTAPINKEAWQLAGFADTGHQEVLSRLTNSTNVKTMLVSGQLRCMHLSTHKSLADACRYVTRENVLRAIEMTHEHFVRWGFATARIAVAALNPHASDNGLIGREELDEIAPAVAGARAKGIDATGPHPADSVFNAAIAGKHDVVVVMYHDQGHIPIKVHGFEQSIS
ncbi:MAG: 4-hydroxythreonine-4-phosphate dehydrogenase PdxA, partial [bacterium]